MLCFRCLCLCCSCEPGLSIPNPLITNPNSLILTLNQSIHVSLIGDFPGFGRASFFKQIGGLHSK